MIIKKLSVILILLFITACAQNNKSIYYWGSYSDTLYEVNKEQTEANKERHYTELLNIISGAAKYNKKVPPGIYFELSMYEYERGDNNRANLYLTKELALYPEAKAYIKNVKPGDRDE
jgi:hypothetical protein